MKKITPFLWFDNQAEEAVKLYVSAFPNSSVGNVVRNGAAVLTTSFSLNGQSFVALNGGPQYKFTPAISFYTICETEAEIDVAWQKLLVGGQVLMPLNKYEWSEKYGWLADQYGVSWQITLGKIKDLGQQFTPAFMFTGEQQGKAEEAINFYVSLFERSSIKLISRYKAGGIDPEGTISHAQFFLDGQAFIAMDSAMQHGFQFNEAISFVINCDTQADIDYFWNTIIADGGKEGQCGWLKDKYGISWQVVPPVLGKLLGDPNPAKSQSVMQAMLQMKKLDIEALKVAYEQV